MLKNKCSELYFESSEPVIATTNLVILVYTGTLLFCTLTLEVASKVFSYRKFDLFYYFVRMAVTFEASQVCLL